jgi:predicted secreted protein
MGDVRTHRLVEDFAPEECLATVAGHVRYLREACERGARDWDDIDRMFLTTPMAGDLLRSADASAGTADRYAAVASITSSFTGPAHLVWYRRW